jgi:predicted ATPase
LPAGHRIELHRRIAQREESAYGERAGEIASELAHQYSHANEKDNAVRFLQIAGEQAAARCAMMEAERHFRVAIEFLTQLPQDVERDRRECALQLAYGPTLIAVKGWASPETERAYSRAQELCDRDGDPRGASHALFGLWVNHLVRSEFRLALEIAEELLARAQSLNDPTLLLFAHQALGDTAYSLGELLLAKENLEKTIALCGGERERALGVDMEVVARSYAAGAMQLLGYPEQALRGGEQAVALARLLSDPFSVAFAYNFLIESSCVGENP